ncbi:FixH family protein [Robertkochia aurantiaca]|uniref:FixH family protein n=1 Tax=Robertkochia aurantiaca TaxID=2873700 RepID=UPI001CD02A5D|nr:FixH family protein [Robertkochia sp. 3YJGBD-33]
MKINWGTGLVIAMALFISFIMYFVIKANTDAGMDHDLVTEEYYKKELGYQEQLNREQRSKDLGRDITYTVKDNGIELHFPEDINPESIKGTVFLYRPSDKQLDSEITVSLSDAHLLIPDDRLLDGRWNIDVAWEAEGSSYLTRLSLIY